MTTSPPPPGDVRFFAAAHGNHFINEIAEDFAAGFRSMGLRARVLYDELPVPGPDTLDCVVGPHELGELFLSRLSVARQRAAFRHCHVINTEQPGSRWFARAVAWALHAASVSDINMLGVRGLHEAGIPAFHTPLGVAAGSAGWQPEGAPRQRSTDVLFMGYASPRRERFFARHHRRFHDLRAEIRFAPVGQTRRPGTPNTLFGADRTRTLQRSKLLLNIHGAGSEYFEWQRFLLAACSGCVLVSERSAGHEPVVHMEHAVFGSLDDLPDICLHLAEDEPLRAAIAHRAWLLASGPLSIENSCRAILSARQTPAHLRRDPVPLIRRGVFVASARLQEATAAAMDRGRTTACMALDTLKRLAGSARLPAIDRRRRDCLARIHDRLASADPWGGRWMTDEVLCPDAVPGSPDVSVLVTLFNYRRFIGDCIASVRTAQQASPGLRLELIVVDDASTDDSVDAARAALGGVPFSCRLILKRTNTGLADSRNVALHHARGRAVFMLDADNHVLPRGLATLHDALVTDAAHASYGIIVGFGDKPSDQRLMSHLGWCPTKLGYGPYIDAMALFDRASLTQLGGYDTALLEHGWFGWEDYELWLRHAAVGRRIAMSPTLVACYRVHESSMIKTTTLYANGLSRYLETSFPELAPPPLKRPYLRFGRWIV